MIITFLKRYYKIVIGILIIFTFLRLIEILRLFVLGNSNIDLLKFQFTGLFFDYLSAFTISSIYVFPLFLLLYLIPNKKVLNVVFTVIGFILVLFGESFIEYFNTVYTPLDSTLFYYSIKELLFISKSSSEVNVYVIISIYFVIALLIITTVVNILKQIKIKDYIIVLLLITSTFSIIYRDRSKPDFSRFNTEIGYFNSVNKLIYFIDESIEYLKNKANNDEVNVFDAINQYRELNQDKHFVSYKYPYYHFNKYKDVLGKYFEFKKQPPNIVIIVVESLNRDICGPNAYYTSFTPFLDSLENKSLVWDNFLSNAERTFGVMPNVLGSLPYGEQGFTLMRDKMPYHLSLMKILKKNNYNINYFYGGWIGFHNINNFLEHNNVDFILSEDKFDSRYKKMPSRSSDGKSWGYGDADLFDKSYDIIDTLSNNNPRLDVFMTLSSHSPWLINNQEFYLKKVDEKIANLKLADEKKTFQIKSNKKALSVFLYTDNALREYFKRAKKTEWFDNTIFIITGDHRMSPMQKRSSIDKYHVPLIIYSTMLNKAKRFKGVSCHLDITPTILSLLNNRFIKQPNKVHWIGTTLDTSTTFNSSEIFSFMLNNKQVNEMIYKNYYINKGVLFKLKDNIEIEKIDSVDTLSKVLKTLDNYKKVDIFATNNNLIIPLKDYLKIIGKKLIESTVTNFETRNNYFFSKKKLIDTLSFSGEKAWLFSNDTYQPLLRNKLYLTDDIDKIAFDCSFMFYKQNIKNSTSSPKLVYELKNDKDSSILWISESLYTPSVDTVEGWIPFNSSRLIDTKKYRNKENVEFKVYLFNPNNEKLVIDNFSSSVVNQVETVE